MEVKRNEERIKVGLAVSTKASSNAPMFGREKVGVGILEELKEIKEMQQRQRLTTLMEY